MFKGIYNEKSLHPIDIQHVLERAAQSKIKALIITGIPVFYIQGTNYKDSLAAHALAREWNSKQKEVKLFCTAGIHPTCSSGDVSFELLSEWIQKNQGTLAAIGECGLDYDRLHYSCKEDQKRIFSLHFEMAYKAKLPLFLHHRACHQDFMEIVRENGHLIMPCGNGELAAAVHSFTGDVREMQELVDFGFFIGVNGCSLKSEENLKMIAAIPLHRILLETDSPWCQVKASHAGYTATSPPTWSSVKKEKWNCSSMIKGRNEPCLITQVSEIVSKTKGIEEQVLIEAAYENTLRCFKLQIEK